jgi:hypothetical protein
MKAKKRNKVKEVQLGNFTVQGTNNLFTANRAVMRLLMSKRCGLKEARYQIGNKTIVIKPRT